MKTKIQKVSSYLKTQGLAEVASGLQDHRFDEACFVTQFLNSELTKRGQLLKTNQWDKVLHILNDPE